MSELTERLRSEAATGLDLSPGNSLCGEAANRIEALETGLRDLLEQVDSLEDFTFSRDLLKHRAAYCWSDAIKRARALLGERR